MSVDEEWREIPGYEGRYAVSDLGRVKSLSREVSVGNGHTRTMRGRILRPGSSASGHLSLPLGRDENGKISRGSPVHRLVLLAFVGLCPEGQECRHLDGDPTNNRLSNLTYGTRSENIIDVLRQGGVWRKLSVEDVLEVRRRLVAGETGRSIAKEFGVAECTISAIKTRRNFAWLT
jgi:hypothetical protein